MHSRETLCLIPARAESVRVPNKNFRRLPDGTTLTERAVKVAIEAGLRPIIISNIHRPELYGCPVFFADPQPDGDWPQLFWKVKQVLEQHYEEDPVILLQPTAALRRADHVLSGLLEYKLSGASCCVSVVAEPDGWGKRDGTFYIFSRGNLKLFNSIYGPTIHLVKVPQAESLNVDTEADWAELVRRVAPASQSSSEESSSPALKFSCPVGDPLRW